MGGTVNRTIRMLLSVMVGALCVPIGALPAAAHNSLTGSNPKNGARLDKAPDAVRLSFLAALDADNTEVSITGPGGGSASAGKPTVSGKIVTVPLRAEAAGRYTVAYQVPSGDGHPVKGQISFTLTVAAAGTTPTPAGTPSVAADPGTAAPAGQPGPSPAVAPPVTPVAGAATDEPGSPWWPWALGGLVLVLLVGGAAVLVGRRTG